MKLAFSACFLLGVVAAAPANAQEDLARRGGCLNCHSVEPGGRRMPASSLQDIATRFKGKPDAEVALYNATVNRPHPPVRASSDDVKAISKWMLTLAK